MTNLIKFITEFIIAVYTIYLSKILSRTFLVDVHMQIATCRFSLNDNYLNEQIQKWTLKFYSPYCRNSNTKQVILKSHCLEPCIIMRIRVRVSESENVCVCDLSRSLLLTHCTNIIKWLRDKQRNAPLPLWLQSCKHWFPLKLCRNFEEQIS